MGGQYPPLDRKDIIRWGFTKVRNESSHAQWEGYVDGRRRIVTVKKLKRGTDKYGRTLLANMIRQSGFSKKKFYKGL